MPTSADFNSLPGREDSLVPVLRAIRFAAVRHDGQRRKSPAAEPYLVHPVEVAEVLMAHGVRDALVLAAAILHDVLEDTPTEAGEVRERFGEAVLQMVEALTDTAPTREERKRSQVEHAPSMPEGARLIKMADQYCNLRTLPDEPPVGWSEDSIRDYILWSSRVFDAHRGRLPSLEQDFDRVLERCRAAYPDA